MTESLDQYSKPKDKEKTKLATIYTLNFRDSKKGRLWIPIYDVRFPFKFEVKFSYLSKFLEKNNAAGNHYHLIKKEILIPLNGKFEFHLENVETKEKEIINLNSNENKAIYIKTGISHKVISLEETGMILVLASTNSSLEDEIDYKIE